MKRIFTGFAVTIFLFSAAQNYPVSTISEDLKKNADAVIRSDKTVLTVNKINSMKFESTTVTTVLNEDGNSTALASIHYSKGDNVSDIKAVIYDADGKKIKSYGKSDFKDFSANSDGTFYSDSRVKVFPYSPASYPYTIEFSYTFETENTVFIPDFMPFRAAQVSLEKSEFIVNNNSGIELRKKVYPSPFNYAAAEVAESGNQSSYAYKNVRAVSPENYAPGPEKLLPKVSFALSSFNLEGKQGNLKTWEDFGSWYYNNLLIPVSAPTPEIKAEVAKLNLTGTTEEKVKKLYQFMQQKTRYVFVALGIGGWQPMTPDEVQKKGYGDCKGLTNYMKTLLDAAGIPSYYSVIWMNRSPISFDKDFPKMGGNHVILTVPSENGNIWLENTSQQIAFNHLSFATTDRNVLAIKPKGIEIINTPVYQAESSREELLMKVNINEDNSMNAVSENILTGSQYDFGMPLFKMDAKEKQDFLKAQWEVLSLEKLELKNLVNDRDKAEVRFATDLKAINYSKSVGEDKIFRAVPVFSNPNLTAGLDRILPVEISLGTLDNYIFEFTVPAGYKIAEIPDNTEIKSEFGIYTLKFNKISDSKLTVNRSLKISKNTYPKEKYKDFVSFRKRVAGNDNSKILITKI